MHEKKRARSNGKRRKIMKAAQEIIAEKGVRDTTIAEIAQKAGVFDSVIYHYFKNKEHLVFSLLDVELREAIDELAFHFEGILDPVSKLGKMMWYHLHMNSRGNPRTRKSVLMECRMHRNFQKHKSFAQLMTYVAIMDGILGDGMATGVFRPDLNIPVVRSMILGMLDEASFLSLIPTEPDDPFVDFKDMVDLVLRIVANAQAPAQSKETKDKHTSILLAAKTVFAQKGYNEATMLDVAARAGVAEGTVYDYFKNKQDLLFSISKSCFHEHKTALDKAFRFDSPLAKFRRLIWRHFSIFAADPELVTVFFKDTKLNKDFYTSDAHTAFLDYHGKISEVIDEGKTKGIFRRDLDNRIFRNLFIGSLSGLYTRWFFREPLLPIVCMEEMNHFVDLLCRAITATEDSPG